MPSAVPQLYQYSHVPETKEELDWADCKTQPPPDEALPALDEYHD